MSRQGVPLPDRSIPILGREAHFGLQHGHQRGVCGLRAADGDGLRVLAGILGVLHVLVSHDTFPSAPNVAPATLGPAQAPHRLRAAHVIR